MQTIFDYTGTPFYLGDSAPNTIFDDSSKQIKNGSLYVDISENNIYKLDEEIWNEVIDASFISANFTENSNEINTSETNLIGKFILFQTKPNVYYTIDAEDIENVVSFFLPAVYNNKGAWVVIEDKGYGINIMNDPIKNLSVLYRLGGITDTTTTHCFFCDGVKWHLAKSFIPFTQELGGMLNKDTNIDMNGMSYTMSSDGNVVADISSTTLYDTDGDYSLGWTERILYNENNDEVLNWTEKVCIPNIDYGQDGLRQGTVYADFATGNLKVAILKATLTGATTINSGDSATLTVTFTCGVAPWSIDYSDGINSTTINDIMESPYEFEVSPTVSKTFTLVAVNDQFDSGEPSGNPRITVIP